MIYLDQASTSFPKPREVLEAVAHWYTEVGVSPDRGDGARCAQARRVVEETRSQLASLCGMPAARLGFTSGATESINLALRGLLSRGDAVLTTALEHSSVVRPLNALRSELELQIEVLAPRPSGWIEPDRVAAALAGGSYRALVFSHASNVLGTVLDAAELCRLARQHSCLSLVDASQSAGLLPLDVGADVLVASAHKSLLGPPGLGFLAVGEDVSLRLAKQGGTGSAQALDRHPEQWPEAIEAGTPNTPSIFGLHAALRRSDATDTLASSLRLVDVLRERLASRGYDVLGPDPEIQRVPIVSFTSTSHDTAELGVLLAEAGVHVRTGFHCAPWLHAHLGTERSGTVRVSPGPFNGVGDIDALCEALP